LTYPNATAALLASVSLVVLGRLTGTPGSVPLVLAATGLLTGLAATMSRAGALALVVGLVVLAGLRGLGVTARAIVGPVAGALVATIALLPSLLAAGPPRPALALVGPGAGLVLAAMVGRVRRWAALVLLGGVLVAGLLPVAGDGMGGAAHKVANARVNLASPDRTGALHAAVRLVAQHPPTGTGPGQADLRWKGHNRGSQLYVYVHNEYLKVAVELGLVGLALLVMLLVGIMRMLWRARPTGPGDTGAKRAGVVAAAAAFAVHSGFDFVWHLPAIVLTVTLLVGLVLPAPDIAPAPEPSIPVQEEEPDENQAAH
jgi:O-antigen ligase